MSDEALTTLVDEVGYIAASGRPHRGDPLGVGIGRGLSRSSPARGTNGRTAHAVRPFTRRGRRGKVAAAMATTTGDPGLSIRDLAGQSGAPPQGGGRAGRPDVAAAAVSLVISVAIVVALIGQAIVFLAKVDLGQLWTSEGWFPRRGDFDVLTIFIGTVDGLGDRDGDRDAPLGLGAAMYLSEYATPRRPVAAQADPRDARRASRASCWATSRCRSSIPRSSRACSVGRQHVHRSWPPASVSGSSRSRWSPRWPRTRCTRCLDALREAAYGIGARRRTVTTKVVFPAAVSGIVASLILGFSGRSARRWWSRSPPGRPAGRRGTGTRSSQDRR